MPNTENNTVSAMLEASGTSFESQTQETETGTQVETPVETPARKPSRSARKTAAPAPPQERLPLNAALRAIAVELKVPKGRDAIDETGRRRYAYRSVNDILEAVKPVCEKYGVSVYTTSEPICVGRRYYIRVTAVATNDAGERIEVHSSAREEDERNGLWEAQLSGSCESYAKKYALQNLFMLDDSVLEPVVDPDADPRPLAVAAASQHEPEKPLLTRGVGVWMSEMTEAGRWRGTLEAFEERIRSMYRIEELDLNILLGIVQETINSRG